MPPATSGQASVNAATLSAREKETLRLLLRGHDAKSIARQLDLSVHTINERLRDARRKLGVASSREAARLLAATEQAPADFVGDQELGVAIATSDALAGEGSQVRQRTAHRVAWFGGGMIVMSLLVASIALSSMMGSASSGAHGTTPPATSVDAAAAASQGSARAWLALVDGERWEESWRTAATMFQSHVTAAQWAAAIEAVRQPLGAVSSRTFASVTKATTLPGAPDGNYEVLEFHTDFAGKRGAVETVTLAHEGDAWKVAGYFIR